ncbi:MAG: surface lipoprotein assembly modifier, partial [Pseudomonadales bacterium]
QSLLERGQRALPAQVHRKWSQKLAAREDKARLSARKVLGVDLGFDDNLTSLTPSDSVYIPSSNQYLALDNHRREEGVFSRLYVGGSWRYNTQADRWWQLDTFAAKHWDDSYSQHQVFAALSFHRPLGKGRLGAQLDTVLDGGQDLDRRRSDALQLSYRQPQGSRVWQAKVRAVNTHFSGQSLRDDRRLSLDLDVEQALDERWQVKLGLSVSADIKDSPERADLDYRTTGISLALKRDLSEQWQLFIDADYQHTRYRGEDSSFQRKRRDSRTHLQLRLRYQYSERSSFSASIGHTRNQSNISLNQYRKNALRLGYLYQFE